MHALNIPNFKFQPGISTSPSGSPIVQRADDRVWLMLRMPKVGEPRFLVANVIELSWRDNERIPSYRNEKKPPGALAE